MPVDWQSKFEEFQNELILSPGLVPSEFAAKHDLPVKLAEREFAKRYEQKSKEQIGHTLHKVAKDGLQKVAKFIDGHEPADLREASELSKIAYGAADRIGYSPAAVAVQVNQQMNVQVNVPPLFEGVDAEMIRKFMEPPKEAVDAEVVEEAVGQSQVGDNQPAKEESAGEVGQEAGADGSGEPVDAGEGSAAGDTYQLGRSE